MFLRIPLVCLSAFLVACPASRGALSIDLKTDLAPEFEIQAIEIRLSDQTIRTPISVDDRLTVGTRVARFDGLPNGRTRFEARLFGPGERLIAVEQRGPVLVDGETVVTLLYTRRCAAIECPPVDMPLLTACLNAVCVAPECGPENLDACGDAICQTDADCSPSSVACAQAECVDGGCLEIPRDEACDPGSRCTLEGCLPLPRTDAGTGEDAGTDAGTEEDSGADGGTDTGEPCTAGLPCDASGGACATGRTVCNDGVSVCEAMPSAAGTPCRAAVDDCDAEERCDGVGLDCPADLPRASGELCRAAANSCDAEELCDGTLMRCPDDVGLPARTECADTECSEPTSACFCLLGAAFEEVNCARFECGSFGLCASSLIAEARACTQPDPPDC